MDPNDAFAFVEVIQRGSFTAAARALGLPKSVVSRRLAHLEEALGVKLLQRTTRAQQMTEAGAAFFGRAKEAVDALREASRAATERQDVLRGVVRVTMPPDMAAAIAPLFSELAGTHPEIVLDVQLTGRIVDLVSEGFDLAIRAGRLVDSSLVARKVAESKLVIVASREYVARRGEPTTLEELSTRDAVLFRSKRPHARWDLEGPKGPVTVEIKGNLMSDDFTFVLSAVLSHAGVALIPLPLATRAIASGQLVRLLPQLESGGSALYVVWPPSHYVPERVRVVREFLVDRLSRTDACDRASGFFSSSGDG